MREGEIAIKNILVIEDDVTIGNMIEQILIKEGYGVYRAYSGTEALFILSSHKLDLVLLDLMLPGLNGEEVLSQIKGIPVIVVSAKIGVEHKVDLLLNGAADYITKPFDTKELLARIIVQLRNTEIKQENSILVFDDLKMDNNSYVVYVCKNAVKLTKTEYFILRVLLQNPTRVMTKSKMLDSISDDTPDCMESSLKVHISNLRKKLRDISGKEYIESVWGIGYKIKEE